MKYFLLLCTIALSTNLLSQTKDPKNALAKLTTGDIAAVATTETKSVMMIDIKARTSDLISIYTNLKRDISPSKIVFELSNGEVVSNIIEITPSANATMMLLKSSSNKGIKLQSVFTEDIKGISTL